MAPLFGQLALRGTFPLWLAAAILVAATVGSVLLYRREAQKLPDYVRLLLALLRSATVAIILILILRPTWMSEYSSERPRSVAVLLDLSASMSVVDPRTSTVDQFRLAIATDRLPPDSKLPEQTSSDFIPAGLPEKPSRWDVAKAVLANPRLNLLESLKEIGPLDLAGFGAQREGLDAKQLASLQSLAADKPRTALVDAAFESLNRDENELPTAVVIATDGRENANTRSFGDLAEACKRLGIPLHIYGVGGGAIGQLQIRDLAAQDTLFSDDTALVPVRYRSRGLAGKGRIEFKLTLNDKEVAKEIVEAVDGEDKRAMLKFVPTKADAERGGKQILRLTATYLGDSVDPVVDTIEKSIRIVDKKLKVLVVESQPRWEFKFLQRGLMRDRRCEAKFILLEGDPKAMKAGDPFLPQFPATRAELMAYDLLVLGDVPASYFSTEQQEWIRDSVAEGAGFLHIAGKASGPSSYLKTPIADVLPIEYEATTFKMDPNARSEGFHPVPTFTGERSPLLSLDDDAKASKKLWETLPPMIWHYPVAKLKPAADAYLVHPTDRAPDNKPRPLYAGHHYGKGFALFVAFDETWRWRRNEGDKYFYRFWSQAVYATAVSRTLGTKMTQLSLDATDPQLGSTGQIYAHLLNSDLKPIKADRIAGTIERLDAAPSDPDRTQKVVLNGLPNQAGEFVSTLPFDREGRFLLKVENGEDTATLEYRVQLPPNHEQAPGPMNEDGLRALAEASGGRFYREEDLHELPGSIERRMVPFVRKEEFVLWNRWTLLLVIGLLGLEWTIRKLHSLS